MIYIDLLFIMIYSLGVGDMLALCTDKTIPERVTTTTWKQAA